MRLLKRFFRLFTGLRGKLTFTYTLVTVAALLALEIIALGFFVLLLSVSNTDKQQYISDVYSTLSWQIDEYLAQEPPDTVTLQAWLDDVYASGYASVEPTDFTDSPTAAIAPRHPMYILSVEGIILAQTSQNNDHLIGSAYEPPDIAGAQEAYQAARRLDFSPSKIYVRDKDGSYWVTVPVHIRNEGSQDIKLVGFIILNIEPPPAFIVSILPVLITGVLITAILLLMGVAPFGTLFGFIMAHSLTRRLSKLVSAVDAWSEGDFDYTTQDRSQDEIGYLSIRLRRMAEQIQVLMQTRQELATLEERNRLARELHDAVKQQIFAAQMQLRAARNTLASDAQAAGINLAEAEELVKSAQQELGMLIAELRPAALEDQGLPGALRAYLETWSQHAGIQAALTVSGERNLDLHIEQQLYRVAQEALANIARHSGASKAFLQLEYTLDQVELKISDNGTGFEVDQLTQTGFGLDSMQQRVAEMSGVLSITSEKGKGTQISAIIPTANTQATTKAAISTGTEK